MTRTLIRNADILMTMDDHRREIPGGGMIVNGGVIESIGESIGSAPGADEVADEVIDASGCVITPGLVNTHHHLFQTLTRAVPAAQNARLFDWLTALYPIWSALTPSDITVATRLGLAELALSGCSMSSDHLYLFPNGVRLEDTLEAAADLGMRFHATRGAMSLGESAGALPPDSLTEKEPDILADAVRVIDAFHDSSPGSMVRIGVAPCSPFSVSQGLMRDCAALARDKNVMLHTHLAENDEDVAFSLATFGCRPGQYAADLGWLGEDVWHAHCGALNGAEIALFAETKTGIAHCPGSNCRLGSGIAPVREMLAAGVRVGLGVDGSASNDSGHLLTEARQAMLMQRVREDGGGAAAMTARQALEIATRGGAQVLNRPECGVLAAGRRADIAIWDVSGLAAAGAWDPVAALVLCGPLAVRDLLVEGGAVVRDGRLVRADEGQIARAARQAAARLFNV